MKQVDIKEAINKRYPYQVVMVTSVGKDGKPDVMPVGWFSFANREPSCLSVSIGYKRYTHKLISETKEFTVCFPSVNQEEAIKYCGNISGADVDKFAHCNLEFLPAIKVKAPLIKNSAACFECRLVNQMDLNDHTVFAGVIVATHVSDNKKIYNFGRTDDNQPIFKEI